VLSAIKSMGLPSSPDSFLRPLNSEVSVLSRLAQSSDFTSMFSLLVNYNSYIHQLLTDTPGYEFALKNAYEVVAKGENPLAYLMDDAPKWTDKISDFTATKFEQIASEICPDGTLHENILPFYKQQPRTEMLPPFIALYESILDIYQYFKRMIGVSSNMRNKTGSSLGIRVSDAEFSVIVTEHEKLGLLSKLKLTAPVNDEASMIEIAAVLMRTTQTRRGL